MRRYGVKASLLLAVFALAACERPVHEPGGTAASAPVMLGALTIENAVARPPLGGQTTGVGYLVIRNGGDTADRLVAASSPVAEVVELHTHTMANGVMRMERVEGIDIPPRGEVVFAPKGLHLMLFGFAPAGATAPIELEFEMAGEKTVDFPVQPVGAGH